jgi:amidase
MIPRSLVERAISAAASDRERIARIFDQVDALVLPLFTRMPLRLGEFEGYGGARSLDAALAYTPFPGLFNHTGLPAIALPTAATQDGFPLAVQIVGPPDSEPHLLALAAQLEAAVGWPERIPRGFES